MMNEETFVPLEELEKLDRHNCNCPIPYSLRRYYPSLGTWTNIQLCCFVRAVEKLTGETFYQVFNFVPLWEWDCDEMVPQPDGTKASRGAPPMWLLKRKLEKGIRVLNVPKKVMSDLKRYMSRI